MNFDFIITDIHRVIMVGKEEYKEDITEFNSKNLVHNEIIFVLSGEAKIFFNGKEMHSAPGMIRFLPKGEVTEYRVEREIRGECIDVFFDTNIPISSEAILIDTSKKENLEPFFKKLFLTFTTKDEGFRFECISLLYKIFAELQKNNYIPENKFMLIKPALDIIHSDFLIKKIKTQDLAKAAGISVTYLKKLFGERFGVPPKRYIIQLKINYAEELLRLNEYSIAEIAAMSGYSDVAFFSKQFKEYTNISPSEFTKKYRSTK